MLPFSGPVKDVDAGRRTILDIPETTKKEKKSMWHSCDSVVQAVEGSERYTFSFNGRKYLFSQ